MIQGKLPRWLVGDATVAELITIEAALLYQAQKATPRADHHSD